MNEEAILHIPDSKYCFAINDNTAILRLRTAKTDIFDSIEVIYGSKYDFYKMRNKAELQKQYTDNLFDYYIVKLTLADVRLVYVFELTLSGKNYYFSEDGITETFDFSLAYFNSFQLPYINAIDVHREVKWMGKAVFYQIFIDRFSVGDFEKDIGYINLKWGEIPSPKSFAGGDIKGIIKKLDYLSELGINVLYLTPVFCSVSNHKYDISDYYNIDRHFGTNRDFKELVGKAHQKGIRIVLDAVFNHCSENLPQFQDVVKNGKKSEFYSWFKISGDRPEKNPLNYQCFASCDYMPKFNTSDKSCQKFLTDIALHWVKEYDIDGWRLDVSDEVSHNFWRHFREKVKEQKPECVIIGENWHDANPFLQGDQYDSIMNYAFTKACYDYFINGSLNAKGLAERLSGLLMRNSDQVNNMMLNILDSHDTHRFLTQAEGDADKLICALALTFMYSGAPGIYYGTEIGMTGGYDPDCRRTFDWNKADTQTSLNAILRLLTALKKERVELHCGTIMLYAPTDNEFVLERTAGENRLRLILNNSGETIKPLISGGILLSHKFNGIELESGGFVIEEGGK